jgi:serine/threonine-protein kinase RsbT
MRGADATHEVIGTLKAYFSEPIAKVLVASTLRRAHLGDAGLDASRLGEAICALERALPMYIGDERRRAECVTRLRRLNPDAAAPESDPPRAAAFIASTTVRVETEDDALNAREAGRDIARRIGFAPLDQMKIATTISELTRNILLYTTGGTLRVSGFVVPQRGIEIAATDHGPGIANVAHVMSAGYRSRTGMGMGLKGAKRLMDSFEIESKLGIGTTVVARKYRP